MPVNTSECTQGKSVIMITGATYYDLNSAVPRLRLVPAGPQYNVMIQTPFTLQCIAEGYPVTTSIRWIKIQGNGQSGKYT